MSNEHGDIVEGVYMTASHKPSMNLRFVERKVYDGPDGAPRRIRILQQMFYPKDWNTHEEEWRDVPLAEEHPDTRV